MQMSQLNRAAFLLVTYAACWTLAYVAVMGFESEFLFQYFVLGWTFSGGEYPALIWFGSLGLFVVAVSVAWLVGGRGLAAQRT